MSCINIETSVDITYNGTNYYNNVIIIKILLALDFCQTAYFIFLLSILLLRRKPSQQGLMKLE